MVDKETSAHRKREDALASGGAGKIKKQQSLRHRATEESEEDLALLKAWQLRCREMVSVGPEEGGCRFQRKSLRPTILQVKRVIKTTKNKAEF